MYGILQRRRGSLIDCAQEIVKQLYHEKALIQFTAKSWRILFGSVYICNRGYFPILRHSSGWDAISAVEKITPVASRDGICVSFLIFTPGDLLSRLQPPDTLTV